MIGVHMEYRFWPSFQKDLKKIRQKNLKEKVIEGIEAVKRDPLSGDGKAGDLAGFSTYEFNVAGVSYRFRYVYYEDVDELVFILVDSRESFYSRSRRLFASVKRLMG